MGIWEYITSTANAVNQNAVRPTGILRWTSYFYCRAAADKITGTTVPNLSQQLHYPEMAQFATNCAKNAAVFACLEGLKMVPGGGGQMFEIISRSVKLVNLLLGGSLDLLVVNSFGSAFQALFRFLLLPFMSKFWGIPFRQLAGYLKDGAVCFLNVGSLSGGCDGASLLRLLFALVIMGFNILLMLHLLKISSAVLSSLASKISVPILVYVFTLQLPYLGAVSSLPTGFVARTTILALGLLMTPYTHSSNASSPSPN